MSSGGSLTGGSSLPPSFPYNMQPPDYRPVDNFSLPPELLRPAPDLPRPTPKLHGTAMTKVLFWLLLASACIAGFLYINYAQKKLIEGIQAIRFPTPQVTVAPPNVVVQPQVEGARCACEASPQWFPFPVAVNENSAAVIDVPKTLPPYVERGRSSRHSERSGEHQEHHHCQAPQERPQLRPPFLADQARAAPRGIPASTEANAAAKGSHV